MEKLYKILDENGDSCNGGNISWSLPKKQEDGSWKPGEWMPRIEGELIACENGYHLCRGKDLMDWLNECIFEATYRGNFVEDANKIVVREARLLRKYENWNEETARLFACWCVRNTPLMDGRTVWDLLTDTRSRKAVEIAEEYVAGKSSKKKLAAAWDAAWNVTVPLRAGARAASRAAACTACTDTRIAPWDAEDAAWEAAGEDATREPGRKAARDAQTKRLMAILEERIFTFAGTGERRMKRPFHFAAQADGGVKLIYDAIEGLKALKRQYEEGTRMSLVISHELKAIRSNLNDLIRLTEEDVATIGGEK